jgi:drug/metabolite transporter (DMT)-like permease
MLNHVDVSRLSYVAFFPPMVAIFIGWIFLGESLSPISLVGAGLVITGGSLINYQSRSLVQSTEIELSPIPKD